MSKGTTCLKITGILLIIFGVLNILFAMMYGFVGAFGFDAMRKATLTGLLVFYGLFGILVGFFQIGVGAMCLHQSKREDRWLRCVVWGIVILALGIFCTILLFVTAGRIHEESGSYPQWFAYAIVIGGGIVLPLLVILGGFLHRIAYYSGGTYERALRYAKNQGVIEEEPETEKAEAEAAEETEPEAAEEAEKAEIPAAQSGRLAYLKGRRTQRIVDPRIKRRYERG